MNNPHSEKIEKLRKKYPAGTRVVLDRMDDIQAPPSGTGGVVIGIDAIGDIMVGWDNGSSLKLIPGVDSFHIHGESE